MSRKSEGRNLHQCRGNIKVEIYVFESKICIGCASLWKHPWTFFDELEK
jgi:hypothetical protein